LVNQSRSAPTTSRTRNWAKPCPTGSTTSPPTPAGSTSAPRGQPYGRSL
jgi:hypothetical protein